MARCNDCNKFVSYDQEVELEDNHPEVEVNEENKSATISGNVSVKLNCSECGSTLRECDMEFEIETDITHEHIKEEGKPEETEFTYEAELDEESCDKFITKDSKGKDIPHRFQKHLWGASISGIIKCSCGWEQEVNTEVFEQASAFNEY